MNTVVETENPRQYLVDDLPADLMSREEALKELERLKSSMTMHKTLEDLTEKTHKVNKLKSLIDNLEETQGWDCHSIQKDGDSD